MTVSPSRARRRSSAGARRPADPLPVAQVAVDTPLAHLDRPFDYLVDEADAQAALPGTRVRVRFSGRLVDGFVLSRLPASEHPGRLGYLERVVSTEQVLTPETARLCRSVADRYAGTMADVLRLAVPPRHARAEQQFAAGSAPTDGARTDLGTDPCTAAGPAAGGPTDARAPDQAWRRYRAGVAFLDAVAAGKPARAVWQALPGEDWPQRLAEAAAAAQDAGRGAVLVVPDGRDLERLIQELSAILGERAFVALSANLGPAERYRRFLRVLHGQVLIAAGTRAAAFAPVRNLGLVAVFDDGDDLLAEPRAPYPHTREVLMLRAAADHCALLIGGFARTAEAQELVETGWAKPIVADRPAVRAAAPRVEAAGDSFATGADSAAARARLSPAAFEAARAALGSGAPVLVQVPRRGYLPSLACARCHRPAHCRRCRGPMALTGSGQSPACRWCGTVEASPRCAACGSGALRATVTGARRTAEELGRAFPGVRLIASQGDTVSGGVPAEPAIVVATPGAEPVAENGYGAALLLDGAILLGRPDLRAAEETLRRWMAAAALVRPARSGGRVVVGAASAVPTVQALIRWDPAGHAAAELAARRELGFPPAVAMASLTGEESAVLPALETLPDAIQVLGPVPVGEDSEVAGDAGDSTEVRALLRVPLSERRSLAVALRALSAARSARKAPGTLRARMDPVELI